MKISAFSILDLQIGHSYFASGTWKGLSFEVEEGSRREMERHRLQLKPRPKGFCVVRSANEGAKVPPSLRAPFNIRVQMHAVDPYYYNYTALPAMELRHQCLYFTNHPGRSGVVEGQISMTGTVSEADCLPVYPRRFQWASGQSKAPVVVRDLNGLQVLETTSRNDGEAMIDLQDQDLGCYSLQAGEEPPVWVVTVDHWGTRPAALIDLHLDPGSASFQGTEASHLQLQFAAREIYWRYNVQLGKKPYAADAVEVMDPDQGIQFGPAELVAVDDEQQLRMISTGKVRLQERYPFSLELVQRPSNLVLARRLPFPDYRHFKRHPSIQEEYLAETFLSL